MVHKYVSFLVGGITLLLLLGLAACSLPGSSPSSSGTTQGSTPTSSTNAGSTLPVQNGTPASAGTAVITQSTPNTGKTPSGGPIVITASTPASGGGTHGQQIVLGDRTLIITSVSKQNSTSANVVGVSLTMTVKNTGKAAINNQATYYALLGAEGDAFGLQSSVTPAFIGSIPVGSSRTGTVVFQVPSAAVTGIRLFFRPEVATETVIAALNM